MGAYGMEDKEEMCRLNDKLAAYMHKVRTMGAGNESAMFLDTIRSIEDEVRKIKAVYEKELDKSRQNLEEANRQKNAALSELEKTKRVASDLEDWYRVEKDKNGRLLCDINQLKERVASLEKELALAKSSAQGPQQQLNITEGELMKEKAKCQDLAKALDCEKAKNKQLQDKIKELQCKGEFNEQLKNETSREANNRLEQAKKVISDLENKNRDLQRQNDGLPQLLDQMRKKTEQDLKSYQKDVENTNTRNLEALKRQIDEQTRTIEQLRADYAKIDRENQDLMTKLRIMEGQIKELNNQKATLENQICQERAHSADQIKSLEKKLKELQDLLMLKMQQLNAGKDVQLSLKTEIEAYRLLLEEEEQRLGSPIGRSHSQTNYVQPTSGLGGRGSGMGSRGSGMGQRGQINVSKGEITPKAGNEGPGKATGKYEVRTEYQYAYNKWGRSTLPRIEGRQGGLATGRGKLSSSCNGNMRAY